jgi:2-methylcitrate dehydratase PrpD
MLARQLVAKLRDTSDFTLPAEVIRCAQLHLADAIGVGLAASRSLIGVPYSRLVEADRGGAASLLNANVGVPPSDAAMINGGLIHSLEYDDTHTASVVHGSAVIAAAALAVGESVGASGQKLLGAFVRGWEVLIRLGAAAAGKYQANGFQITPVGGTIAAALVASDLMKLDEDRTVAAVGISLSQASGVFEFLTNGSSVKSLHPGWAAHSGIIAAQLAQYGMTGPETALEGRFGLFRVFAGDSDASGRFHELVESIGKRWYLLDAAFKFFPCCHYIHPFLEAVRTLSGEGIMPDQVAKVICMVPSGAATIICEPWDLKLNPPTPHAARWSLPIVMAEQWLEGTVTLRTFERTSSKKVRDLASRMVWEPLPNAEFPEKFGAKVSCHLRDGGVRSIRFDDVYGNVSRPAKPDEVWKKFRSNAELVFSSEDVEQLETVLLQSGELQHLGTLTAVLRSERLAACSARIDLSKGDMS